MRIALKLRNNYKIDKIQLYLYLILIILIDHLIVQLHLVQEWKNN